MKEDPLLEQERPPGSLELSLKHSKSETSLYACFTIDSVSSIRGTTVAQWLRCCATDRKVAGSIPDDVIGIFH